MTRRAGEAKVCLFDGFLRNELKLRSWTGYEFAYRRSDKGDKGYEFVRRQFGAFV